MLWEILMLIPNKLLLNMFDGNRTLFSCWID